MVIKNPIINPVHNSHFKFSNTLFPRYTLPRHPAALWRNKKHSKKYLSLSYLCDFLIPQLQRIQSFLYHFNMIFNAY